MVHSRFKFRRIDQLSTCHGHFASKVGLQGHIAYYRTINCYIKEKITKVSKSGLSLREKLLIIKKAMARD